MHWETLIEVPEFCARRSGRFQVTELLVPHRVLSTSVCNGGQVEDLRYLVNHQICEGAGHKERYSRVSKLGLEQYHRSLCQELDLPAKCVASMETAANMNYATVIQRGEGDISVAAIVTAGVQGNVACAGDPTTWSESQDVFSQTSAAAGTINTQVLLNCPVTEGALARAVVTITEAKTSALQQLAVRSRYSTELATGTTTDQFCVAAPLRPEMPRRFTGTGIKLGEYIGVAVRDATLEALRWHNGLELSYTRSIFHALGRYCVKEDNFLHEMAPYLKDSELELLKNNYKAVMYEPLVSAAAYAFASILDRCRYGVFPASTAKETLRQQAACMAACLAGQPDRWLEFHSSLPEVNLEHPEKLILAAIALGWSKKWI